MLTTFGRLPLYEKVKGPFNQPMEAILAGNMDFTFYGDRGQNRRSRCMGRKSYPCGGLVNFPHDVRMRGGAEGNRTPVRKQLDWIFSGRSLLFPFPRHGANKHAPRLGSFIIHGAGKAYCTHGHHSDHTLARLVVLPGRMGA